MYITINILFILHTLALNKWGAGEGRHGNSNKILGLRNALNMSNLNMNENSLNRSIAQLIGNGSMEHGVKTNSYLCNNNRT